ncbi:hypothetical protein [Herbidospora galbida]|nr:hypothetical protein [Herbidospora galbida]
MSTNYYAIPNGRPNSDEGFHIGRRVGHGVPFADYESRDLTPDR